MESKEVGIKNVAWRHVMAPKDGVVQLGFTDAETGQVIRLNMRAEEAQKVIGAFMDYLDPTAADLQVYLNRKASCIAVDSAIGEPTNAFYPPFRGVRVSKCDAGKWWFSRQIGMEAEWEETTFNDLFNLGIDIAYLESVVPGFSYYMRLAAVEFFTTKDM